jgi:drug/metabolite transporter (DMT)-like permease
MNRNTITIAATGFGFLAAIFFLAPSFNILPQNVGNFLGIVSGIIAAFGWAIRGRFNA